MESRRLVAVVTGAALLVGSLGGALLAVVQSSGFLGSGGNPAYGPLVPLFLVVAAAAPFAIAVVSSPDGWMERGGLALLAGLGVLIVGFAFGLGAVTAAVGVVLALAVECDDREQRSMRLLLVAVAAVATFPALLFFHLDGWGYALVPAGLAVGAIVLADRITSPS
jgi:hypothetical protein